MSGDALAAVPQSVGDTPVPSLAPVIKRISPAVVNIGTRGTVRERGSSNPLLEDPFFRRFFDVPPESGARERPFQSAGSGVIFRCRQGLHRHQRACHRECQRDHRHAAGWARPESRDRRQRPAVGCRGAEGQAGAVVADCVRRFIARRKSAILQSRSAIRSGCRTRSRRASSVASAARASIPTASRISSRPTPRSTRATRAAR